MGQLFDELKRRNVFRVAVAYVVASWLVLQVADLALDGIEAPAWVMKVFMLVLGIGLPIILLFSWAYEITPDGIRKERDVARDASITHHTGRKLDMITIGMLVAVLGFVVFERTLMPKAAAPVVSTLHAAAENSIAVLAFDDLSPEGDQGYFADGLSEELLNVLAQVPHLQVAGRTSSFAFKGQQRDLREIGDLLNVAHILEGSVRKAGNQVRITAQLINASDGFHLYSATFDRDLDNIFAVQDEIAGAISKALLTEIVGTEVESVARTDGEAYELYLMARTRIHTRDLFDLREADAMLDRALEIDPNYAPVLAQKGLVTYLMSDTLGAYGDVPFAVAVPATLDYVDRALARDADLAEALAVKGLVYDTLHRNEEAAELLRRAVEINPTLSDAANWLSNLMAENGSPREGAAVLEGIVERDPTYGPAFNNLTMAYAAFGNIDKAESLISRVERIVGSNDNIRLARSIVSVMSGASAEAVGNLAEAHQRNASSSVFSLWYGFALLGTADYARLAEIGLPEHRMLALAAMGDSEGAMAQLRRIDLDSTLAQRVIRDIGLFYALQGDNQGFIDYVLQHYGALDDLLEKVPDSAGWGAGYSLPLAAAYRQVGDEDTARKLLAVARDSIAADTEAGFNNWVIAIDEFRYAAMTGDAEAAARHLERSINAGYRWILFMESPEIAAVRESDGIRAGERRLLETVNAERAELGMPPYQPLAMRTERPSFVN